MGNQQERLELELAWLAGIIEGEGWITLGFVKSMKRNKTWLPTYVPNIGVVNTDLQIMDKVQEIFDKIGIKYRSQLRKAFVGNDDISRKEKREISVASHSAFKILAHAIYPYMVGIKKKRIDVILDFINLRASKPRSGINSRYGDEEHKIYESLYSYKGKSRSRILNDYTPGSQYCEKI